jgi:hypothetical protein
MYNHLGEIRKKVGIWNMRTSAVAAACYSMTLSSKVSSIVARPYLFRISSRLRRASCSARDSAELCHTSTADSTHQTNIFSHLGAPLEHYLGRYLKPSLRNGLHWLKSSRGSLTISPTISPIMNDDLNTSPGNHICDLQSSRRSYDDYVSTGRD